MTSASAEPSDSWSCANSRRAAAMSPAAAVRWLLLGLVGLVDWGWMKWAGFHIGPGFTETIAVIAVLIAVALFYFYTDGDERLMEFAHFGAQYVGLYAVMMPLSFLAVSTNAPLVDGAFDAIDKALGLDWVAWTRWVGVHPLLHWGFVVVYGSLPVQQLFCYIHNLHSSANWKNREMWWITFVSGLVTIAASAAFPASDPYVYYGLAPADHFLHVQDFLGLRDGTMHVIGYTDTQGLVQLPSFHTIVAIMLTYNLRHHRWLFAAALALNVAVILSCPTEGNHYFIDIFGGGTVAAATIWAVRAVHGRFELPRLGVVAG